MNRRLCWRNEGCVWIVQGGDREHTSEISQGYSVLKPPVLSGLMSSHLKHWTAVYVILLKVYLNNQTPKITRYIRKERELVIGSQWNMLTPVSKRQHRQRTWVLLGFQELLEVPASSARIPFTSYNLLGNWLNCGDKATLSSNSTQLSVDQECLHCLWLGGYLLLRQCLLCHSVSSWLGTIHMEWHEDSCRNMFTEVIFIKANNWKVPFA